MALLLLRLSGNKTDVMAQMETNRMSNTSGPRVATIELIFSSLRPLAPLAESEEFGPVFLQEPDDVIYPLDANEKRVVMHCEARGNPPPTYRCDRTSSACSVLILQMVCTSVGSKKINKSLTLLMFYTVGTSIGRRSTRWLITATASWTGTSSSPTGA